MPPLIELKHVSWSRPDGEPLLDDLSLSFGSERSGLIGRNGAGKTTLLKIMAGDIAPSSGAVHRSGTLAMLHQQSGPPPDATLAEAFGIADRLAVLARIEAGEASERDLAEADWTLAARFDTALAAAGLDWLEPGRSLATLSGGQATRAALAALLFAEPDMLLLDEPTNNLDTAGRSIVADMLAAWKGGAVVVSHDHALLRRMDRIIELSGLGARVYGGGWDLYAAQKAEGRDAAELRLHVAKRSLDAVERDIQTARERQARRDGRGQRGRARRDQPKSTLDHRKETAEQSAGRGNQIAERKRSAAAKAFADARSDVESLNALRVDMPSARVASTKRVLKFESVSWRAPGGTTVLRDLSFVMVGPERVAVTGPNGAGKTTLLRLRPAT